MTDFGIFLSHVMIAHLIFSTVISLSIRLYHYIKNYANVFYCDLHNQITILSYFQSFGLTDERSLSHKATLASLGIRQSPRGESDTLPTFTPSGRHERLNC